MCTMAGHEDHYTVRFDRHGDGLTTIGVELPLETAKDICRRHAKARKTEIKQWEKKHKVTFS